MAGEVEAAFGPVTLLVNNAGSAQAPGPLWELDPDEWWRDPEVQLHAEGDLGELLAAADRVVTEDLLTLRLRERPEG